MITNTNIENFDQPARKMFAKFLLELNQEAKNEQARNNDD